MIELSPTELVLGLLVLVLAAEREAIIGLRDAGVISEAVLRRIERDLDLEALRTDA